jgi:hypothetical protein
MFLSAGFWLLQLPPADTSQWTEKRWVVHRVNHSTENLCMTVFGFLAVICLILAIYRWLRYRGERYETPVA